MRRHLAKLGILASAVLLLVYGALAVVPLGFVQAVWDRMVTLGVPVLETAIAIALLVAIVIAIRQWSGGREGPPIDPIGFIEWILAMLRTDRPRLLNVQCRLSDGALFLRNFVPVNAHNGRGAVYALERGVFHGCDADHVDVGSQLTVTVGSLRFQLKVKLDDANEMSYVEIPHTRQELIALLNTAA